MTKCANCNKELGDEIGESSIHGAWDSDELCVPCFEDEEELIEREETNSPEFSEAIAERLKRYHTFGKAKEELCR